MILKMYTITLSLVPKAGPAISSESLPICTTSASIDEISSVLAHHAQEKQREFVSSFTAPDLSVYIFVYDNEKYSYSYSVAKSNN